MEITSQPSQSNNGPDPVNSFTDLTFSRATEQMLINHEDEQCSICQTVYTVGDHLVRTPCNHHYHAMCLSEWMVNQKSCPYCRVQIVRSYLTTNDQMNIRNNINMNLNGNIMRNVKRCEIPGGQGKMRKRDVYDQLVMKLKLYLPPYRNFSREIVHRFFRNDINFFK